MVKPETTAPERYGSLKEMPADKLAANVVGSLIMAKGNLNTYASIIERLIVDMRKEYEVASV